MSRKKTTVDTELLKKIGARIKQLRKSTGLKQALFGKSIGITQSSVSDLENGKYPPKPSTLLAIQYQYSISPHQVLTGEGFSLNNIQASTSPNGLREVEFPYPDRTGQFLDILQKILNDVDDLKRKVRDLELQNEIDDLADPAEDVSKRKET